MTQNITDKNSLGIFDWLSIFFIGAILLFGFSFFKGKFLDNAGISFENTSTSNPINIKIVPFPGFTPNQEDESMKIYFSVPNGMVEDEEAVRKNGVYKIYRSMDNKQVHPESAIVISFVKKKNNRPDLGGFILSFGEHLKKQFPGRKIDIALLNLPKDVVKKFDDMGIPYQAIHFFIAAKSSQPGYNCVMFFFETPDGYWTINWSAPRKILEYSSRERDAFLILIKFMGIGIMRSDKMMEIHM